MNIAADPGPVTAAAARSMRALRAIRGLSAEGLAALTGEYGYPIPRSIIANLENGRRAAMSVDELDILARVFRVDPWSMTTAEPMCIVCHNDPPPGFTCSTCQRQSN